MMHSTKTIIDMDRLISTLFQASDAEAMNRFAEGAEVMHFRNDIQTREWIHVDF